MQPGRASDRRWVRRTWRVRWPLVALIVAIVVGVEVPTIAHSIVAHRGSRPAASADDRREVVVRLDWIPGDDPQFPRLPTASLAYRDLLSGPEGASALVKWPVPAAAMFGAV